MLYYSCDDYCYGRNTFGLAVILLIASMFSTIVIIIIISSSNRSSSSSVVVREYPGFASRGIE